MFISGAQTLGATLFIKGQDSLTKNTSLFVGGKIPINSSISLFEYGSLKSNDSMNLYIRGTPAPIFTSTANLFIRGTTAGVGTSAFTMPLTITGSPLISVMNLFISGMSSGATSEMMNMFIEGSLHSSFGSVPLFIQNNTDGLTKRTTLYIEGAGQNAGHFPIGEDLNLFICRGPNAGITLFICNTENFNTTPLFISGSVPISTRTFVSNDGTIYGVTKYHTNRFGPNMNMRNVSPTLFIEGAGGEVDESVSLYIVGNAPIQTTGNVSLVIPNVAGLTPKNLTLYINGFRY
jgi:hypothetical protein